MSDKQQKLIAILHSTKSAVKILSGGKDEKATVQKVTPELAIWLVKGAEYDWGGSKHRVRWMRKITKPAVWEKCWRTTSAAVYPPSANYLWRTRGGGKRA